MTTQTTAYTGAEPITLEDAKTYLKVSGGAEDGLIQGLISAARSHAESYTSIAIRPQTIMATFEGYRDELYLNGPVVSIQSVTIRDSSGAETTVPAADYFFNGDALPAKLFLRHAALGAVAYVTVTYEAGHTDRVLPEAIVNAMYHMIDDWYSNREDGVRRFPTVSRRLLDLERRNYFALC